MYTEYTNLKNELETELSSSILNPLKLSEVNELICEIDIAVKKLQLYNNELVYYYSNEYKSTNKCFCDLIITNQPFPKPFKHKTRAHDTNCEEPLTVQIITAPKSNCRPIGLVTSTFKIEEYSPGKNQFEILNSEAEIDEYGTARFHELRFPSGSRKKMVQMQFKVKVKYAHHDSTIGETILQSIQTKPFIVMTNENQWIDSEFDLFKYAAFKDANSISWFKFANVLQDRYLRATRQDLKDPQRPLSQRELHYLWYSKYLNGKSQITLNDFESFWKWFGQVMHKIRHQKPFVSMWLQGHVFGFIGRDDTKALLQSKPNGSFLIRFSEQIGGGIVIAFVHIHPLLGQKQVDHYLLTPKELDDIVDVIAKYAVLKWILPTTINFESRNIRCAGEVIEKKVIVEKHSTPIKPRRHTLGYVNSLGPIYIPENL